ARLPDDTDGLPVSALDRGEQIEERLDLPVAADEVAEALRTEPVEWRQAWTHTEEPDHDDGLAPPLHLDGPDPLALDVALDEPPSRLAREDCPRLGQLLEAGGQVRGVADGRVIHPQVVADRADDHEPGVQPHADGQRDRGALDNWRLVSESAGDPQR